MILGCTAPPAAWKTWAASQGGLDPDAALQQRLARVASGFAPLLSGQTPRTHILHSRELGAYSWPDESIFITRGLMERVDDAEVAAVMAHELGHLLDEGHLRPGMAIQGCAMPPDAECRADLLACRLLEAQDIPSGALVGVLRMLEREAKLPAECRRTMRQRIEMLGNR